VAAPPHADALVPVASPYLSKLAAVSGEIIPMYCTNSGQA